MCVLQCAKGGISFRVFLYPYNLFENGLALCCRTYFSPIFAFLAPFGEV